MDAKFNKKNWLMSTLRRASYRWPPKNEAEKQARVDRGLYKCASCGDAFRSKEYAIDHIEPVIPNSGFPMHPVTGGPDWTIVIDRLFCDLEGFQVLCHSCHDIKTGIEDTIRATLNAEKKAVEKEQKILEKEAKKLAKNKPIV